MIFPLWVVTHDRAFCLEFSNNNKKKPIDYTESIVNSTASNSSIQQRKTLEDAFDFQSINISDDIS